VSYAIVALWCLSSLLSFVIGLHAGHHDANKEWERRVERLRKYRDA